MSDTEEDLVVDAPDTLSNKCRRGGNNNDNNDGQGGGKMDDVVKVAAVLDKSDKGGSRVNNNVHYDGADGHQRGTSTMIIMDKENMVRETLPLPFFASRCHLWR